MLLVWYTKSWFSLRVLIGKGYRVSGVVMTCSGCLRFMCMARPCEGPEGSNIQSKMYWVLESVSKECCQSCSGQVFPPNKIMSKVQDDGSCEVLQISTCKSSGTTAQLLHQCDTIIQNLVTALLLLLTQATNVVRTWQVGVLLGPQGWITVHALRGSAPRGHLQLGVHKKFSKGKLTMLVAGSSFDPTEFLVRCYLCTKKVDFTKSYL